MKYAILIAEQKLIVKEFDTQADASLWAYTTLDGEEAIILPILDQDEYEDRYSK